MIGFDIMPLLPEIFLALAGGILLIAGVSQGNSSTRAISWAAIASFVVAIGMIFNFDPNVHIVMNGMVKIDAFSSVLQIMILTGLIAAVALSMKFLKDEGIERFEYPILIMFAGIGMLFMVAASNMLSLYMSLELQSLSLYVLAAFHRNSLKSSEAGIKYFILGALSSGMLLFGISLIYGYTGSLDYSTIETTILPLMDIPPGLTIGLVFMLCGLAFKISAVPFHMWAPDVYQGAPTGVTALFAIVPKIAAMGMIIRLLFEPFSVLSGQWEQIVLFISAASMIVGAFAAIAQSNIKRLMAYSSIGNMGYALIGVVAGTEQGITSVIIYMLIYLFMTAGAFAVILTMRRDGLACEKISDLQGLSRTRPVLAYSMAILMFSMSGIPPMAGFFGKLFVFQAAIAQQLYVLAVLGVLSSVVGAYYYLKIIKVMFFDEITAAFDAGMPFERKAVLFASIAFVMLFILKPSFFVLAAQGAAAALFSG